MHADLGGRHQQTGSEVHRVLVEAVAAAEQAGAEVHEAGALDVQVTVVVPLARERGDLGRVAAFTRVVPAVAQLRGRGVDLREGGGRRAGVAELVGAVVAAAQVLVREPVVLEPGVEAVLGALDVQVAVAVMLVGVRRLLGDEQGAGLSGAVVLPAVAELLGVGVDVEGGLVGVGRAALPGRRGRGDRGEVVLVVVDELGAAVRAVGVAADREAVQVLVPLVRVSAGAVAEVAVAVVVQLVAQLGGAGVDVGVAVVTVVVGVAREQVRADARDAVAVFVQLLRIEGQRVAVVVDAVGDLRFARVDVGVARVAVAALETCDVRRGPALHVAVAVGVDLAERDEAVAVVVDAVADLDEAGGGQVVAVVAVPLGVGPAVAVAVQLAADAVVAGVARQAEDRLRVVVAVLVVAQHVEAGAAVRVEALVAGALVVHQAEDTADLVVRVSDLRREGEDVG